MSTIAGRTAPAAGGSPLDHRLCGEVGDALARARTSRGMSVTDVTERLLLSTRQVRALEQVEFAAFHNGTFYLSALKKYAAFLEIDPSLVARVAADVTRSETAVTVATAHEADFEASSGWPRLVVAAIVLLAAAIGGYAWWTRATRAPSTASASSPAVTLPPAHAPEPPPVPVRPLQPAVVTASEPAAPAAPDAIAPAITAAPPVEDAPRDAAFAVLRAGHATWLFLRKADGAEVERQVTDGEIVVLETPPQYLALGNPDATLTVGGRAIELAPFIANGQLRIRSADFDALAARRATP
jgi:cytoskeleton protein RodZ